jgi:hypothetical protein
MVIKSINIVDSLSFDIIAFVVAAKDVLQYFVNSLSNFKLGTQQILNSFKGLCQSFLDLNALVSQNYLNNIDANFKQILLSFN